MAGRPLTPDGETEERAVQAQTYGDVVVSIRGGRYSTINGEAFAERSA